MNPTRILQTLAQLPPFIDYCGYRFVLSLHNHHMIGPCYGYILFQCLSKKAYKRAAHRQGFWDEKSPNRRLDSTGEDFLVVSPLLSDSDQEFQATVSFVWGALVKYRIIDGKPSRFAQPVQFSDF